jgi:hypothetical protein
MTTFPKPIKRSTVRRKRRQQKADHIGAVFQQVWQRDGGFCRFARALGLSAYNPFLSFTARAELAHDDDRGMGGNPNFSRDTTENTLLLSGGMHRGPRSKHSGHLKIRPLTDRGLDGPVVFEVYEELPSQRK